MAGRGYFANRVVVNVIADHYEAVGSTAKLVEKCVGPETDIEEAIRCEFQVGLAT